MAARHRAHAALLVALVASACGGGEEPVGEPAVERPQAQRAPPPQRRAWRHGELPELFGANLPQLDAAGRTEAARKDAERDDWPSEALLASIQPALQHLVEDIAGGAADLEERLSQRFEGGRSPRPGELQVAREDEFARVRRADPAALAAAETLDAAAFVAAAQGLAELLGPDPVCRLVVLDVARPAPERAQIELMLQLEGQGARRAQVNATWRLALELPQEGAPRLLALSVLRHEELEVTRGFFVDATTAVFGGTPGWRQDMLHGIGELSGRIDRSGGAAFQGMQGLAVGDLDGNGLDDVFVGQQVGAPNRLYLHLPDGGVREVAAQAGVNYLDVTRSALILDLDNDGRRDLAMAVGNAIVVAYNDGKGVFSRQRGFDAEGQEQFYSLAAADADGDGDLDLFGCRYSHGGVMHGAPQPYHDADNGVSNMYLRNDGLGEFVDATDAAGFGADNDKFSLAATWVDLDADGDMDLYVVNDFGRNNLWVNDGTGRFVDRAAELGLQDIGAGMGVSVADYDLDGDPDVYVTNMFAATGLRTARQERFLHGRDPVARLDYVKHARGNSLLRNRGDGSFEDVTELSGAAFGRWAWGSKFVDFDGDGWDDLFVPNGLATNERVAGDLEGFFWRRVVNASPVDPATMPAYKLAFDTIQHLSMIEGHSWNGHEPNNAYLNLRDGSFVEVGHAAGLAFLDDARAAAAVDWDDDGREDLIVRNRTAPRLRLLLDRAPSTAHFASFQLVGRTCNRDAVGAAVTLTVDGRPRTKRVTAGDGYLAQSSLRQTFGLGAAERIERVEVRWPDGTRTSYEDLAVDRHYLLDQGAPEALERAPATPPALARAEFPPNVRADEPLSRIPLFDPLPIAALELPAFEGPARRVDTWADELVLLHLWSGAHESGPAELAALSDAHERLREAGVRVVCLTTDEGPARAKARRTIQDTPFAADAGFVDGRTREALLILVVEMLGAFDRLPLPFSMLLDRKGRITVLYLGPLDLERVLADAEVVSPLRLRSQQRARALAGGPWFRRTPPRRTLVHLAEILRGAGFEAMAEDVATLASRRKAAFGTGDGDDE